LIDYEDQDNIDGQNTDKTKVTNLGIAALQGPSFMDFKLNSVLLKAILPDQERHCVPAQ
jgi:hypothetical protein